MKTVPELRVFAEEIRVAALKEFKALGFGHVGGAMSIIEALAVLYGGFMRTDPQNPDWAERDRLVCSKGHAGPALYAALALKGYFDELLLYTLNKPGTSLPSHCDRLKTPGIDMTTGSLGQGMSTAIGLALGQRLNGQDAFTYLIIGDGECNEGQIWEGAQFAPHYKLNNLILLVDENGKQLDGNTRQVIDPRDLAEKFAAFGWFTQRVNGHDVWQLHAALQTAKDYRSGPSALILKTTKGNGCAFVRDMASNHHVAFTPEQIDKAIEEAEEVLAAAIQEAGCE